LKPLQSGRTHTPGMLLALALVACALLAIGPARGAPGGPPHYLKSLRVPGAADTFKQPLCVHADLHAGEVFVCDRSNNRLVIFDERGLYKYQIIGGSTFATPFDLAVDPDGYIMLLALVDGQRAIVRLDYDGRFVEQIALSDLPEGILEPQPISIALSPAGDRLYVLDQANFRLWIADAGGRMTGSVDLVVGQDPKRAREEILGHVDTYADVVLVSRSMAGSVLLLDPDGVSRGTIGIKGTSSCESAFPVAAALDTSGNVVILDQQRTLMTVWQTSDRRCVEEISGIGEQPGYLYQPADLTLDGRGRLYVSQGFEGRVQIFEHQTGAAGPDARDLVAPR